MMTERRDGSAERKIVIAMVVNKTVLAAISSRWSGELFSSRWANIVGGLCVDFYRKYRQPPLKDIEGIIDAWAETGKDKETIGLIDNFLRSLSEEYTKSDTDINPQYVLDLASDYFDKVGCKSLAREINGVLEIGDVQAARELIRKHRTIELGTGSGIDVLTEESGIISAMSANREPLIVYPGALGQFFKNAFERDAFISFLGKEKIGKSWWLIDAAWRALLQKRKVAFFAVGDMSQDQMMRRFASRATNWPIRAGVVKVPTEIDLSGNKPKIVREEREFPRDLTEEQVKRAFADLREEFGANTLKLSTHPNSTITVDGISGILEKWEENDGWIPDVVVIDYADIIAPVKGILDTRAQIDYTWKQLRALAQERHNLVITATQSNKQSYNKEIVDRSNITEDKRKLAHVTGMVGLNQQDGEQTDGIYRLNWVVLRELEFSESQCCYTAACLALGEPAMLSTF